MQSHCEAISYVDLIGESIMYSTSFDDLFKYISRSQKKVFSEVFRFTLISSCKTWQQIRNSFRLSLIMIFNHLLMDEKAPQAKFSSSSLRILDCLFQFSLYASSYNHSVTMKIDITDHCFLFLVLFLLHNSFLL